MMRPVFEITKGMNDKKLSFCAGCGHGIVMRLIAESLEELGVQSKAVCALGIGCCAPSTQFANVDFIACAHGRAASVATGLKRCNTDKIVYTYQGDGDCYSIGLGETQWSAIRGGNFSVFCVNNTLYGMTGGLMSPTTMEGQITTTSPRGRDVKLTGKPVHIPELFANIQNCKFSARVSLYDTAQIRNAKKQIKKALENQINGVGFSFVEILSPCPSNWHKNPAECMDLIRDEIINEFPVGIYKDAK